jgi:hypothetical protein
MGGGGVLKPAPGAWTTMPDSVTILFILMAFQDFP